MGTSGHPTALAVNIFASDARSAAHDQIEGLKINGRGEGKTDIGVKSYTIGAERWLRLWHPQRDASPATCGHGDSGVPTDRWRGRRCTDSNNRVGLVPWPGS